MPLRVIHSSSKGIQKFKMVFQGSFKVVLRKFQGCLKKSRVFQECFNEVFFAILLLHGSHRNYPSRRRACFYHNLYLRAFLPPPPNDGMSVGGEIAFVDRYNDWLIIVLSNGKIPVALVMMEYYITSSINRLSLARGRCR